MKSKHRALAPRERHRTVVGDELVAQDRIAGEDADLRTVGHQAIVAMVHAGDDDGDHLPLQGGEAGFAQHQFIVVAAEQLELARPQRVGAEHVRHEADLLQAAREYRADLRRVLALIGYAQRVDALLLARARRLLGRHGSLS